jgi:predicted nucleotidyltransferase
MARSANTIKLDPAITRFAKRLSEDIGATAVLLIGSRAKGTNDPDSDYDIIIVSERFAGVDRFERQRGLKLLFYEVGGFAPMDLYCLTPEEFEIGKNRISMLAEVLPEAIDLLDA